MFPVDADDAPTPEGPAADGPAGDGDADWFGGWSTPVRVTIAGLPG